MPVSRHSLSSALLCLGLILQLAATGVLAASNDTNPSSPPDFSGAWRLDETASDTASTVTALLRKEATREQPVQTQAPTTAPAGQGSHPPGGRHGAGGGSGNSGMGGGGMGGGHGHHGGGKPDNSASSDSHADVGNNYPLPQLLQNDAVMLVQQDRQAVQIRLDNGELLNVRLDGQARQSLNGDAMANARMEAGDVLISIQFADGSLLEQRWFRSADGHHLTVYEQWKIPLLQQPVSFKRSYVAVG